MGYTPERSENEQQKSGHTHTGYAGGMLEITPEMIEAGVSALLGYDPDWDRAPEVVESILRCALSSRKQPATVE